MGQPIALNLVELRDAVSRVLDQVASDLGSEFLVEDDYYWHLPVESAFDMTGEPSEFSVGQVTDDLELLSEQAPPSEAAWHDLAHLIGLLRVVEKHIRP